jgi:DNA-binding NtrC family response regulator
VFPIALPPLRDRREDLPALTDYFCARMAGDLGRPVPVVTPAARAVLSGHSFPGNVRELGNVIERLLVRCHDGVIDVQHLIALGLSPVAPVAPVAQGPALAQTPAGPEAYEASAAISAITSGSRYLPEGLPVDLASLERLAMFEALRQVGGNRTHAARMLGISLRTLRNKLREMRKEQAAVAAA